MTSRAEVLGNRTIGGEEALGVARGLESSHAPLALAGGLVGVFGAVVEISVLAVLHPREHLPLRGAVAFQLVGNDHPGHVLAPPQQLAEELLGRVLVPTALHQNIQPSTVLIDRPPEIVPFAVEAEEDFIEVPLVTGPGPASPQRIGIGLPKFPAPISNSFVRHGNAAFHHKFLSVAVAEAELEIQSDRMADDLHGEAMTLILVGCSQRIHAPSMPNTRGAAQVRRLS